MSKRIMAREVTILLCGVDITNSVYKFTTETPVDGLSVANLTVYLDDISKSEDGKIVYKLGDDGHTRCGLDNCARTGFHNHKEYKAELEKAAALARVRRNASLGEW